MRKTLISCCLCTAALVQTLSARADETTACTDAASQGQTERDAHRLVEARNQLLLCARQECPSVVRKDCTRWLEEVQASLPTVVPIATDVAGNGLPGVKVSIDGKPLLELADGRAIEVNPGAHMFAFEAADGTKADLQVVVAEGQKDARVAATLGKPVTGATAPTPPPAPNTTLAPASPSARADGPRGEVSSSPWKAVGIVAAGVGIGGLGVGSAFGVMASSKKDSAGCDSNSRCATRDGVNTLTDAQNDGNVATAFFVGGSVLAAAGIAVWALAPRSSLQVAPNVGRNTAGMLLRGVW